MIYFQYTGFRHWFSKYRPCNAIC